jgi:pyruvate dehydrogenase E2 component (dihydrolipoamide acetyltransferase)
LISKIIVPDLGATGGDVHLQRWLVEPGDQVQAGQPLYLVETDKATVEVESFRSGVVHSLLVEPGSSVSLGSVVAIIADAMEEIAPETPAEEVRAESDPQPASVPFLEKERNGRILVSPLARRMAEMENIDLSSVEGSGRQGQILKRDVERVLAMAEPDAQTAVDVVREPVPVWRESIARRTLQSKTQIPHFYATISVDMAEALALKTELGKQVEEKNLASPTITDFCLRAVALALRDFPALNASFQDEEVLNYQSINIGLVVGLKAGGMLVPIVRDADGLNLHTLAAVTRGLRERAEGGILSVTELSGGTFTLSNLGMYGLDSFTAIINPPQAGILALGAVQERPSVQHGVVIATPILKATLSVDHRLVDGIDAARFLAAWKERLEHPASLLIDSPQEHAL